MMPRLFRNLNATLMVAVTATIVLVCGALFLTFDLQARADAIHAAQKRQEASLRILIDQFASEYGDVDWRSNAEGVVEEVHMAAIPEITSHDLIDNVGHVSGETATLFAWVPDEGDFIRVTTNIIKPDGNRAVGTWLGKENPVHATMLRKETFKGEAVILGKPYYTIYEPIIGPEGTPIGIFYVGVNRSVVEAQIRQRLIRAGSVTLVSLLLALGAIMLLLRRVLDPLDRVAERVSAMAEGDLEGHVPATHRHDALGRTARAIEEFRTTLRHAEKEEARAARLQADQERVVKALQAALSRMADRDLTVKLADADVPAAYEGLRHDFEAGLAGLSEALMQACFVAQDLSVSAQEIGGTSHELSQRVEGQASTLVESAAALDVLTRTSAEIAVAVGRADSLAQKSRSLSDESGAVVQNAISAIIRIEEASDKINEIISAIDDIAFQTNLLSLNAGVEAARAGEAGRGFAVVAQEVRSLAQTAAHSAQEIKALILHSSEEVRTGAELVQKTGTSLEQVQTIIGDLVGLITQVAEAVRQQSTGLGEVNASLQELQNTTQHNAAFVEELNAAGLGLSGHAGTLTTTLGAFSLAGKRSQLGGWQDRSVNPQTGSEVAEGAAARAG
jgi:methyl-accepting chemotaxis protein